MKIVHHIYFGNPLLQEVDDGVGNNTCLNKLCAVWNFLATKIATVALVVMGGNPVL
jgi:hypothetical protein